MNQRVDILAPHVVSPYEEMGAYEWLWTQSGTTFKRLAERFAAEMSAFPSAFADRNALLEHAAQCLQEVRAAGLNQFGVRLYGASEYPQRLRDAEHPVQFLYYVGHWNLIYDEPLVAVVGTRSPTDDGVKRTRNLVKQLVKDGCTIVSGLAAGIDTVAHTTAIEEKGSTIGVLGTPVTQSYPKSNADLQKTLGEDHLLVSSVPFVRYREMKDPRANRMFFPERNKLMSALTNATVIVEASNTSGTLTQARAAIAQRRKLFILESCFNRSDLTWPRRFEDQGAIRVRTYDDIRRVLLPDGPKQA